jgi:UDP-N-acetylglucosamine 1-carboxyvinyltransferase
MAKFIIQGGNSLQGEVRVSGNKNSALKLFCAALLADSPSRITNVPDIGDVNSVLEVIRSLGAEVSANENGVVTIDPANLSSFSPAPEEIAKTRASAVLAAPLLLKFGRVNLPRPGGDSIGERVLDSHMSMMANFGANIERRLTGYTITATELKPTNILLEEASVTATEMALMVSAKLPGETVIEDAACEPHIVNLCQMLEQMGAQIEGAGSNIIKVSGKKDLKGVEQEVRPDHIEAGTLAIAAAITGGDILIKGIIQEDLRRILNYLAKMNVNFEFSDDDVLHVLPSKLTAKYRKFKTRPWPGFPTDMMSQFIVLATQTEGTVLLHDWMYETRMYFVDHLIKMGANITIADPHRVVVVGPSKLHGELIPSPDIRAGGALVLAALAASGESTVEHADVIDRGYVNFDEKLRSLGADVKRVE